MPYQQILSQNLKSTYRAIWGAPVNTDGLGREVHRAVFAETGVGTLLNALRTIEVVRNA